MLPGMEMMACPNLAVPAEVMQHVVNVESSRNPYAIGVVGGQLVRQPQNLGEAVATAQMLESKGYNYSLGVAQVNRNNLGRYGLDTFEKAFDVCPNLVAGSQILAQCYASAGGDWGKAFSCYYSGNFTTGYNDGYVQKIFESMARQSALATNAIPIPLAAGTVAGATPSRSTGVPAGDSGAYRVAMRSVADAAMAASLGPAVGKAVTPAPSRTAGPSPNAMIGEPLPDAASIAQAIEAAQNALPAVPGGLATPAIGGGYDGQPPPGRIPTDPATAAVMSQIGARLPAGNAVAGPGRIATDPATAAAMSQIGISANATGSGPADGVFQPQVRGPNDPAPSAVAPMAAPAAPAGDAADLRQGGRDGAFVF